MAGLGGGLVGALQEVEERGVAVCRAADGLVREDELAEVSVVVSLGGANGEFRYDDSLSPRDPICPSARWNSAGMIQTLFDSPFAICGSACTY